MGVVYRAYQTKADRYVALKLIRSGEFSTKEEVERFRSEAQSAAQLKHANLVPVYEIGQDNGHDYFTMALIDGKTLHSMIRENTLPERMVVEIFIKLGLAVDYAHRQGVIHRDIKPGNIIVDQNGEPQLTDFGLAKRTNIQEQQTQTGQLLGTVRYMAPEQSTDSKRVGAATDIYGLGATLYECLTGTPPFSGDDLYQVITEIKTRMPVSPADLNHRIGPDLAAICMKCLQKDPGDRYVSGADLANDLKRYLRGDPVGGNESSWWKSIHRVIKNEASVSDLPSAKSAFWFAIITFVFHSSVFVLVFMEAPPWYLWTLMAAWFAATFVVNKQFHWSRFWTLTPVERQSGVTQLSIQIAFVFLLLIYGPIRVDGRVAQFLDAYPPLFLITAVGLMAHGIFSGRWIVVGMMFFPLAIVARQLPQSGPLLLAVLGSLSMIYADRQFKRMLTSK
jgi:serine/threonine protein kinase